MYTISCPGHDADRNTAMGSRCTYAIQEDGLNVEGSTILKERAEAQMTLLQEIYNELEAVDAVFYSHDVPWQFVGHEYVIIR